jgi:hypothetical protein
MTTISLEGLASNIEGEERALAYIKVQHNGQTYDWQAYIPPGADVSSFLEASAASIGSEIIRKEMEWAALDPKTREIEDPMTGEVTLVPIQKEEIVRPEIPDYYAKRRAEYPSLAEQLGAMWKGGDAAAEMAAKIQAVKDKYPKP